jgi:superfamily II DNA or RNA helicase
MTSAPEKSFLDERRLLRGPWQAFERDVARLLVANGFEDVRIIGGTGDKGGDILATRGRVQWVVQCKYTSNSYAPVSAVDEVVAAARYYKADRLMVATSRSPGDAILEERRRYESLGLRIDIAGPNTLLGTMERTPSYPAARRMLYPYQEDISSRFREALLDRGRGQIVLATGLGKTLIMAELTADLLRDGLVPGDCVLVVAHTRELVDQLQRSFWYQLPKGIPTHRLTGAEEPSYWDGITFATIQSVASRFENLPRFGLILVDEAHHIGADTFRRTVEALNPPMLGGVTATPWRGDGYDLDEILGSPLARMGIAEGLQQGFLTEVDYRLLADNVDWHYVQEASRHKYSLGQLNKQLIIPTRDDEAAKCVWEVYHQEKRRGGMVFSPSISHAEAFCGALRRYGFRAESISSDTPARERAILMSQFRSGQLDFAATVDLFNEGVDVPDVDFIVFLRATHSRRIFVQQLGRGLRISPGKTKTIVLDFVTDLRRISEVIELDHAVRGGSLEHLGLGRRLLQFRDMSAGTFLREWVLDQASLFQREDDALLELPQFEYPEPLQPGGIQ